MTEPSFPPLDTNTLDRALGFELTELGDELSSGRFEVEDRVRQPAGIVHGGAYAAAAESIASMSTYQAVWPESIAVGMSNNASFIRPLAEGTVTIEARRRHRGRTTWIWDVDFTDEGGRLLASARVTIAVRPAPAPPSSNSGS